MAASIALCTALHGLVAAILDGLLNRFLPARRRNVHTFQSHFQQSQIQVR